MTDSIVGLEQFNSAEELIRYVDIHKETDIALILYSHLVQLAYLAGWDMSKVSKRDVSQKRNFVSLYDYETKELLDMARLRLKKNLVPENWKEMFVLSFENNDMKA